MKIEVKIIEDDEQFEEKVEVQIWYDNFKEEGGFEVADKAEGGNRIYLTGNLYFEGSELIDYDGVYELPLCVLNLLEKSAEEYNIPVDVEHIRETLR